MFKDANTSGPLGAPALDGLHQGDTLTVAVEENGLRPISEEEEGGEVQPAPEINLSSAAPFTPVGDEHSNDLDSGAQATPLYSPEGNIYAIEVRRLVTTGGYNNLTIGAHTLVDPAVGVDRTLRGLDQYLTEQLKQLGGQDIDDLERKRQRLNGELYVLGNQVENLEEALQDGREAFEQAKRTLKTVGAPLPAYRYPDWNVGQRFETDQAYLLRKGWSFQGGEVKWPYSHPSVARMFSEAEAMAYQKEIEAEESAELEAVVVLEDASSSEPTDEQSEVATAL